MTRGLVPNALWWFRWGAMFTFVTGLLIILMKLGHDGMPITSGYMTRILTGGLMGTLMWANVWFVIWPAQQIVIANANNVAGGGEADPKAAACAARAGLASRTNTLFSIPMLFFMAAASHFPSLTASLAGTPDAEVAGDGEGNDPRGCHRDDRTFRRAVYTASLTGESFGFTLRRRSLLGSDWLGKSSTSLCGDGTCSVPSGWGSLRLPFAVSEPLRLRLAGESFGFTMWHRPEGLISAPPVAANSSLLAEASQPDVLFLFPPARQKRGDVVEVRLEEFKSRHLLGSALRRVAGRVFAAQESRFE